MVDQFLLYSLLSEREGSFRFWLQDCGVAVGDEIKAFL